MFGRLTSRVTSMMTSTAIRRPQLSHLMVPIATGLCFYGGYTAHTTLQQRCEAAASTESVEDGEKKNELMRNELWHRIQAL